MSTFSTIYTHHENILQSDGITLNPTTQQYEFITPSSPRKTGVMIVGLGGNNGSTFVASQYANQQGLTWQTKRGTTKSNYLGTLSQSAVVPVGHDAKGNVIYRSFPELIPLLNPSTIPVSGWDISSDNMYAAMKKAQVLPYDLQRQVQGHLTPIVPLPSIYYRDFIALNQTDRANNVVAGGNACMEHLATLRGDIRKFKAQHQLDHVVVLWSANTERFMNVQNGVHDTGENLLRAIASHHAEISPSLMFAVAAVLEGCTFLNGAPQNTLVPGVHELARQHGAFVGGNDFKSGQTKFKSVMVDYLISSGFKLESLVSYNHLGNNDGKNLSSQAQFQSKKISKSTVIDDMVQSNPVLYNNKDGTDKPDHTVVIKYVPHVGDDKRAMDEYIAGIFMGGSQVMSTYNICNDSLLATPIMFDLIVFSEWLTRLRFRQVGGEFKSLPVVLSPLSFFFKAPAVNTGEAPTNAFFLQRNTLAQLALASRGLECFNPLSRL